MIDGDHVHHVAATQFLQNLGPAGWATCPLTENGLLRILSRTTASLGGSPSEVRTHVRAWCGYQFWPDDVSLSDTRVFPCLPGSQQLMDLYLLGLAVKHGGCLATFDQRINADLLPGGAKAILPLKG